MELTTESAPSLSLRGENNVMSLKYFPSENHRIFGLDVVHGPKFDQNCNSCKVGVTYIKQAFDYLNNATVIFNQSIIAQTDELISIKVGDYLRDFNQKRQKVCIVPVDPVVNNLLDWFCTQFKGQLELAHVNVIVMRSEDDVSSKILRY